MAGFRIPLVDLHAQYSSIKPEIDAAIAGVIEQTAFILGDEVAAFEREFAAFCEVKHCVACGNGTDAISLALQAVGVKAGDEVITVSNTFIATTEAISAIGARPVLVDVREDNLLMDVSLIERALTRKTRAIVPVHLYGQMVDMDALMALARRHELRVVEDVAQAHGARWRGRRAGSFGHAATFSFYPGKNLGAYGDAGAIVTGDDEVAGWLAKARNHGRASKYEHDFEARNSRMDGIQGAVLRVKLPRLAAWTERRRALARVYDAALSGSGAARPLSVADGSEPVYHLYVVRHPRRNDALETLRAAGVEAGIHYPVPLHLQKAYAHLSMARGSLPVTERAAGEILSLPLFPELAESVCAEIAARLALPAR